jgi:hypothetical protein
LRCLAADRDGFFAALSSADPKIFRRAVQPRLSAFKLWRSASTTRQFNDLRRDQSSSVKRLGFKSHVLTPKAFEPRLS